MKTFYTINELEAQLGTKARTLRYWMQECELEDKRIPGQKAYYSQETFERLSFIRKVLDLDYDPSKGKFKPTLAQIKDFLEQISLEQIRDVLSGKEPLEIGYLSSDWNDEPVIKTLHEDLTSEDLMSGDLMSEGLTSKSSEQFGEVIPSKDVMRKLQMTNYSLREKPESALDYLTKVTSQPPKPRPKKEWQTLRFSKDLELRHRQKLTPQQEQQLKLAGKLIESILGKEQ
jgi:DNA-binding transcriptional MerR regulator